MFKLRVLVADDQLHFRQVLMTRLQITSNGVFLPIYTEAESAEEAVLLAEKSFQENRPFDLVLMDINFSQEGDPNGQDGHWASESIREILSEAMIVMISSMPEDEHRDAVEYSDVVTRFFRKSSFADQELFKVGVWASLKRLHNENRLLEEKFGILTVADNMKEYLASLDQVAPDSNVVIYGETGTGKELSARRLNANAKFEMKQSERPFVAVNCGGISATLVESELFGHVKGAFTGATSNKVGFLEAANGGDLFLDELQNAPIEFQKVLMRALQEKCFIPVGSTAPKPFDVRVIVAMNQDPDEAVQSGKIMPDFMARVRQGYVRIPALRERPEDVEFLAKRFVANAGLDKRLSDEALIWLKTQQWAENVRGLEAACKRATVASKTPTITARSLQMLLGDSKVKGDLGENTTGEGSLSGEISKLLSSGIGLTDLMNRVETAAFEEAQKIAGSSVPKKIAAVLKVSDRTVRRKGAF